MSGERPTLSQISAYLELTCWRRDPAVAGLFHEWVKIKERVRVPSSIKALYSEEVGKSGWYAELFETLVRVTQKSSEELRAYIVSDTPGLTLQLNKLTEQSKLQRLTLEACKQFITRLTQPDSDEDGKGEWAALGKIGAHLARIDKLIDDTLAP